MLRVAVVFFVLIFGFAVSAANSAPCPMLEQDSAAVHASHSENKRVCPDHSPDENCEHSAFGDCLDFQQTVVKKESAGSKLSVLFARTEFPAAFNGVANRKKILPSRAVRQAELHIYLLTLRILV